MVEFEHFIKGLGPHAKRYTPEQLRQIHADVKKLAASLLAMRRAKAAARQRPTSPQAALDEDGDDRTLKKNLITRVDAEHESRARRT